MVWQCKFSFEIAGLFYLLTEVHYLENSNKLLEVCVEIQIFKWYLRWTVNVNNKLFYNHPMIRECVKSMTYFHNNLYYHDCHDVTDLKLSQLIPEWPIISQHTSSSRNGLYMNSMQTCNSVTFYFILFDEKSHFLTLAGSAFDQIWLGRLPPQSYLVKWTSC